VLGFEKELLQCATQPIQVYKIPLALFPEWIKKQYNLDSLALNVFVFLEMHRAV
jgi:hypothetical protein